MSGLSITLVFGKYGGFWAAFTSHQWRVCLGWVALTIYPRTDIEEFINRLRAPKRKGHLESLQTNKEMQMAAKESGL